MHVPGDSERTLKLTTYALMAGSGLTREAMETSNRMIQAAVSRTMTRLLDETAAESLLQVVPIIGALVGFAFNYCRMKNERPYLTRPVFPSPAACRWRSRRAASQGRRPVI